MTDGNATFVGSDNSKRLDSLDADTNESLTTTTTTPQILFSSSSDVLEDPKSEDVLEDSTQSLRDTIMTGETTADSSEPSAVLRYDEQACEAHYDERDGADDDLEKGKIRFPQHVLYGRNKESKQLQELLESSIQHETLNVAFLEGMSGVGKSALVWESLLHRHNDEDSNDFARPSSSSSSSSYNKRRICWTATGKYNHNSATQPFSAILHSLEQLTSSIVTEANAALEGGGSGKSRSDSSFDKDIVKVAQQFDSWYDSHEALTLLAFCPAVEAVNTKLKRLYKRSQRRSSSTRYPTTTGHRRSENTGSGTNSHKSATSHQQSNSSIRSSDVSGKDASEASSVASSSVGQQSVLASNDIQELALAVRKFLHCLTSPSRPLIWFLDDLQWADDCSLQLIQQVIVTSGANTRNIIQQEQDDAPVSSDKPTTGEEDVLIVMDGIKRADSVIGLFVGAYRPQTLVNSLETENGQIDTAAEESKDDSKTLQCMLDCISKATPSAINMKVSNLPPRAILEFCRATLDMEEDEAWPLTNALYSATMGNIFHCRQALEHLVRTNCLYYDVMFFSWSYNLPDDGSALQDVVSESCGDVLTLVQSKLHACSEIVRAMLIRAAYTENTTFGAVLLQSLLQATGYPDLTNAQLQSALDEATNEGLLLNITWESSTDELDGTEIHPFHLLRYKFAHDKVKEATYNLLPPVGPQRDSVILPLATVLIQWAIQAAPSSGLSTDPQPSDGGFAAVPFTIAKPASPPSNHDWMWFVGVEHLNSIPLEKLLGTSSESFEVSASITLPSIEMNRNMLAQWNLRVADMSISLGSYQNAVKYLKVAISYLEPEEMWIPGTSQYNISLHLYNKLMEISIAQRQFEETKDAIAVVLARAGSLQDKIIAFSTKIQLAVELNDRNHEFGIQEALFVLKLFGVKFPYQPSSIDAVLEKMKFKMELQGRPISVLAELELIPPNSHEGDLMRLLAELLHMILLAKKPQHTNLLEIVAFRGMRWTLEHGISQHFAALLSQYSSPLRSKGELYAAAKYAAIVKRLFQRFADEVGSKVIRSSDFLLCEFILHAGMLPLQNHLFAESLEKFIDIYRHNLANGTAEYAMSSAMHYPLTYFVCGRPLNALLEAKLVLFQDKASQLNMNGYVALFYCARQVLYNLQGKRNNTQSLTTIEDEDRVLSKLEGRTRDMTRRDFAIYRMMLAVTFGDLDCMDELMNVLYDVPLFDLSFARQTLRMTYCGIAAYVLARKGRSPKRNLKFAAEVAKEVRNLDRADGNSSKDVGNVNFHPISLCLAAVETNSVENYHKAIAACNKRQLVHLKALMCEYAGLLCLERSMSSSLHAPFSINSRMKTSPKNSNYKKGEFTSMPGVIVDVFTKVPMDNENVELGRQFLGKAMWMYQDWNATAKVSQLKQQFPFLKNLSRRAAGIMPMPSATNSVGSLYSNESTMSRSQGTRPFTYFPTDNQLGRSSDCESVHSTDSS